VITNFCCFHDAYFTSFRCNHKKNDLLILGSMVMSKTFFDRAVNKAHTSFSSHKAVEPLNHDAKSVAEADQIDDVDKAPGEPGDKA